MRLYLAPRAKERGLKWFGIVCLTKLRGVFVVSKDVVGTPPGVRGGGFSIRLIASHFSSY